MSQTPRIQPVIMSGGAGTRLWPMSRRARPKQFQALVGARTLFQDTALRTAPETDARFAPPLVIGGADHAGLIEDQLAEIGLAPAGIVTEPAPRNTAAVAAVAAAWTGEHNPGALVLLAPADHHIADPAGFRAAVFAGAAAAADGAIVAFGVAPTRPHTGYGYIERAEALDGGAGDVHRVAKFHEKPKIDVATAFFEGGAHYWNAGIFLYAPDAMRAEMAAHAPEIAARAGAALEKARATPLKSGASRFDLDADEFARCPATSIDYAVMEKTARAAVLGPLAVGWSDIGAWSAIEEGDTDAARVHLIDAANCLVKTDGPYVGVIGADGLVVVAAGGAVLVARRDRSEDVKKLVEALKDRGRSDLL